MVERKLLATARPYATLLKLVASCGLAEQWALRGHTICFEHAGALAVPVATWLRDDIADLFNVMFVGSARQWDAVRAESESAPSLGRVMGVDRNNLRPWMECLKVVNPHFDQHPDVSDIDAEEWRRAEAVPADMLDQAHVASGSDTINLEAFSSSDVAHVRDFGPGEPGQPPDSGVGPTLPGVFATRSASAPDADSAILSGVLEAIVEEEVDEARVDTVGVGTARIPRAGLPMNEFTQNSDMYTGTFPHLFLHGVMGRGTHAIGQGTLPAAFLRHLMLQHDGRFGKDLNFVFTAFNQSLRHEAVRRSAARVKSGKIEDFVALVSDDTFLARLEAAVADPTSDDAQELIRLLMRIVAVTGAKIPFGPTERTAHLSHLYAMVGHFGMPCYFVTTAYDDTSSVLVIRLSTPADGNSEVRVPMPSLAARSAILARNPAAAAAVYDKVQNEIHNHLFGCPATNATTSTRKSPVPLSQRRRGLFGTCVAAFTVTECQGRGSLHGHSIIWTLGVTPGLLQRYAADADKVRALAAVLDSVVCAHLPPDVHEANRQRRADRRPANRTLTPCPLPAQRRGVDGRDVRRASDDLRRQVEVARARTEEEPDESLVPVPIDPEIFASEDELMARYPNCVLMGEEYGGEPFFQYVDQDAFLVRYHASACNTQLHTHAATCHKTKWGVVSCRMAYPQEVKATTGPVQLVPREVGDGGGHPWTVLDTIEPCPQRGDVTYDVQPLPIPDNRVIVYEMARPTANDGVVVTHSPGLTATLCCNNATYPLFNTIAAKGVVFYLVKYVKGWYQAREHAYMCERGHQDTPHARQHC
eukprot:TRINITY_DN835_c0_g1_i11.p1 TRINITY_DN835_c0_g1~~TRINITY_DN835_c0_g1_i11.p1  ORF type:complete len:814 (-),score=127.03 TRINITY_DN835_c0_g1_i11:3332-5773(-)